MNSLFKKYSSDSSNNTKETNTNSISEMDYNDYFPDLNKKKIVYNNSIYDKSAKINSLIEKYSNKQTYDDFMSKTSYYAPRTQSPAVEQPVEVELAPQPAPKEEEPKNLLGRIAESVDNFFKPMREYDPKQNKVFKAVTSPIDKLYEIPLTQRTLVKAGEAIAGEGAMKNDDGTDMKAMDAGKLGNIAADVLGTGIGFSIPLAGVGNQMNSVNNITDDALKPILNHIPQGASKLAQYGTSALRTGADFATGNAVQSVAQGKDLEGIKDSAIEGLLTGAAFGVGGKALKDVSKSAFPGWKTTFEEVAPPKEPVLKSGTYKVKNTALENAQKEYDEAVQQIQNYWGHWKLDEPEIVLGAEELGIDLNKILNNMESAEKNGINIRDIAEANRKKRVYGVDESELPLLNDFVKGEPKPNPLPKAGADPLEFAPGSKVLFNNKEYTLGEKGLDGQFDLLSSSGKPVLSTTSENLKLIENYEPKKIAPVVDPNKTPELIPGKKVIFENKTYTLGEKKLDGTYDLLDKKGKPVLAAAEEQLKLRPDTVRDLRAEKNKLIRDYVDMLDEGKADLAEDINTRIKEIDDILGEKSPLPDEIIAKDKNKFTLSRETFDRNLEDVFTEDADTFKSLYSDPIKSSEADSIRFKDNLREEVKTLNLTKEESELVQKLGENKISLDEIKNMKDVDWQKVSNAAQYFKDTYGKLLDQANDVLKRNGYKPIAKLQNYFPHFEELNPILKALGIENPDLPTDINGLTADFTPGKSFFANALHRKGDKTVFDAVRGFDNYLEGISKIIHHTDNIQRIRSLERDIRTIYKDKTELTNFAAYLHEYGNLLAGKKVAMDRGFEDYFGRGTYKFFDFLRKQTGAQMVGANISSALTNFIPLTQAIATTDKTAFLKGFTQTIISMLPGLDDGFTKSSDYLTRRAGSDKLFLTKWQKVGEGANVLFKFVDNLVGQTIVRGKYNELVKKGVPSKMALKQSGDWAARIMADRSLGQTPTLFNSKVLGAFTQFQLETNNQISFLFKDLPRSTFKNGVNPKSVVALASTGAQVAIASYLFNNLYEQITGRRPAFDILGVIEESSKDFSNSEMDKQKAVKNLVDNISNNLPFTSIVTGGGKIPVTSSLPDLYGIATGEADGLSELLKLPTLALPTGGNQIKKTIQGFNAVNEQGVYSKDGSQLRYPVQANSENTIKSLLFGPSSLDAARNYYDNSISPLSKDETARFKSDVSSGADPQTIYDTISSMKAENKKVTDANSQIRSEVLQNIKDGDSFETIKDTFDKYKVPENKRNEIYTSARNEVKDSALSLIQARFKSMNKDAQRKYYSSVSDDVKAQLKPFLKK